MDLCRDWIVFLILLIVILFNIRWFDFNANKAFGNVRNTLLRKKTISVTDNQEDLWTLKNMPESVETFNKILRIESRIYFSRRMYSFPLHTLSIGMSLITKWFQLRMDQFEKIEQKLHKSHEMLEKPTPTGVSELNWNQENLLPGNNVKIGYYILAYLVDDLWRVKKLIYALFVPEHTIIVVHCDLRMHTSNKTSEFRQWLIKNNFLYPYIWLIDTEQSLIGRYASISTVYIELLCLHTLLTSPLGYTIDSFISMTPADFPIKPKQAILNRLFVYRKFSIYQTDRFCPGFLCSRVENYYCHDFGITYRRGEPASIALDDSLLVNFTGSFLSSNRMTETEKYVVHKGGPWLILSFESVFYLFQTSNRKLLYYWLIYYHSTSVPEEHFFHTLYYIATTSFSASEHLRYYHNVLNYTSLNGSLHIYDPLGYTDNFANQWRYMYWRAGMSPSIQYEDIARMNKSAALYARKFDDMSLFKNWTIHTKLYSDLRPYENS